MIDCFSVELTETVTTVFWSVSSALQILVCLN